MSAAVEITAPGVYDMPGEAYHADPVPGGSLSSSGARKLLPPSCPALFQHWRTAGQKHSRVFDVGHAVHALVLGVGEPIKVIDADTYTTKAARTARDKVYAAGATPLLAHEHEQVTAMAAAVRAHPVAGALLAPGAGQPERTLVWRDEETGVWCRAMLDWITAIPGIGPAIVDMKSTVCAEPGAIGRSVEKFGYYQQDPFYCDGYTVLHGVEPAFLFVFVEKTPPHLVTVCQLDDETREWGRMRNRRARAVYRDCTAAGHWPGYTDEIISVGLPGWAKYQHNAALEGGLYEIAGDAA